MAAPPMAIKWILIGISFSLVSQTFRHFQQGTHPAHPLTNLPPAGVPPPEAKTTPPGRNRPVPPPARRFEGRPRSSRTGMAVRPPAGPHRERSPARVSWPLPARKLPSHECTVLYPDCPPLSFGLRKNRWSAARRDTAPRPVRGFAGHGEQMPLAGAKVEIGPGKTLGQPSSRMENSAKARSKRRVRNSLLAINPRRYSSHIRSLIT